MVVNVYIILTPYKCMDVIDELKNKVIIKPEHALDKVVLRQADFSKNYTMKTPDGKLLYY